VSDGVDNDNESDAAVFTGTKGSRDPRNNDSESPYSSDDSGGFDDSDDGIALDEEESKTVKDELNEFSDVASNLQDSINQSECTTKSSAIGRRAVNNDEDGDAGSDNDEGDGNFNFGSDSDIGNEEIKMVKGNVKGLGSDDFVSFDNRTFSFDDNDADADQSEDDGDGARMGEFTSIKKNIHRPKSVSAALQNNKTNRGPKTPLSEKSGGKSGAASSGKSSMQLADGKSIIINAKSGGGKAKSITSRSVSSPPATNKKRPFTATNHASSRGKTSSSSSKKLKKTL
jgi:hypothetical protein